MKTTTLNTKFDTQLVSIRSLAALTGQDRDTIRAGIGRANLTPAGTLGGYPAYTLKDAIRSLLARHGDVDPATLTPQDRKALADAKLREHQLLVKDGTYIPRESVRAGCAVAYAMVAQAVRSIPDLVERKAGASADVCDMIEAVVDSVCSDLSTQLEALHRENAEASAHS